MAKPAHWLVKSEPFKYSFEQLVADGRTTWDGVRNFEARNNLRAMHKGDLLLFYHSNEGKAVVGVARVAREAYPDPTSDPREDWSVVDLQPVKALRSAVSLDEMRAHAVLGKMAIFRRSRLSVVPVTDAEFETVLELGARAPAPEERTDGAGDAPAPRPAKPARRAPARKRH